MGEEIIYRGKNFENFLKLIMRKKKKSKYEQLVKHIDVLLYKLYTHFSCSFFFLLKFLFLYVTNSF